MLIWKYQWTLQQWIWNYKWILLPRIIYIYLLLIHCMFYIFRFSSFSITIFFILAVNSVFLLLSWLELSDQWWCWDGESTGSGGIAHWLTVSSSSELGGVSSISITSRLTSDSDDSSVNGTWNAVLHFNVKLWHNCSVILIISGCIHDIGLGRLVDQFLHHESLDGLILTDTSSAVDAVNFEGESLILLSPSVVSSLWWHFNIKWKF